MAFNPLNPAYRKVEVHEFLDMEMGDAKAELVDGTIFYDVRWIASPCSDCG